MNKVHIYRDMRKEWRWKLVARNGKTVAESGEGYKRKPTMLKSMRKVLMPSYKIIDDTQAEG